MRDAIHKYWVFVLIPVIIVALLSNIILLQLLPVCGETLWIDLYFQVHSPVDTPLKAADSY